MPRKPLRSQLNQIRAWVRQGRTDAWIAHQLDVPASELREFRRRHELAPEEETGDVELRDEIEAEIEATLDADEEEDEEEEEELDEDEEADEEDAEAEVEAADAEGEATGRPRGRRRRRRRRGRGAGRWRRPRRQRDAGRPSTTAPMRDSACGWTRRSRTIPSIPSTGPDTGPSRSTIEPDRIVIRRA